MLGRGRNEKSGTAQSEGAEPVTGTVQDGRPGGKGRPTPKRRESEARNRRPIVASAARQALTKEERKQQKAARREQARAQRLLTQQAYVTGDERHLPVRDRGPVRRFVRDHVDARRGIGEYFLPVVLPLVVVNILVGQAPLILVATTTLIYGFFFAVIADTLLLRRRLRRLLEAHFGADKISGAVTYGMMRSWQMRRSRLPRPQVKRGQFPS